jgi:6-phosphofructokinase 1
MNAAIRAVTRTALGLGWEVFGIRNGYAGLISGNILPLGARTVGGIIHLGGTMLETARSAEYQTEGGRRKAIAVLNDARIDAVIAIGGNGSQAGAYDLSQMGVDVVGVASTIDNDLAGTEATIGMDTALNIAVEAIDRLRVTGSSLHRVFLVEVMGRKCGWLALMAAIAGGAEVVVLPEFETPPNQVAAEVRSAYERGKSHGIVVVAEGAPYPADALADYFHQHHNQLGFELRVTKLGHIQRGGIPTAYDRILATRFGAAAVEELAAGNVGVLVGLQNGTVGTTPLAEFKTMTKSIDPALFRLANVMAH